MGGRTRLIAAGVVAALALWLAIPTGSIAQEAGDRDTVTVEARRTVEIEPDEVRITFGIGARDASAEDAIDEVSAETASVLAALEAEGFTDDELSTLSVTLRRTCIARCNDRDRDNDVRGFKAASSVRLETGAIDRVGEAIDTAVGSGASSIRALVFDVSDDAAAVQEALTKAMALARSKAETLAEAGGRTLGRAVVIVEGNARAPRPHAADAAAVSAGFGGSSSGGFPIDPPTLDASARIEVTFELL